MSASDVGRGTAWDPTQGFLQTMLTSQWLPIVVDAKNNASPLMSMIPSESTKAAGKYLFQPVKYGRNTDAISAVREGGKLPDPTSAKARPYMFRVRKNFGRAIIDGDIYRASQLEAVRYVEPMQDIMDQMADDIAVEANRQLHNDGSGRLAEVDLFTGGGLLTGQIRLRLNSGIESVSTCQSSPAQFLGGEYIGQRIAIFSQGGVHKCTRVIKSVDNETTAAGAPATALVTLGDPLNPTATLAPPTSGPNTLAIGDWVVRCARVNVADGADSPIHAGYRTEMPGIAGIFGDGFVLDGNGVAVLPSGAIEWVGQDEFSAVSGATVGFQGAPTDGTLPFNQGIVLDGGGVLRPASEALLQLAFTRAEKVNNGVVDFLLSGLEVRDRFAETMLPDKRWINTTSLSGGWTALDYKGKPWATDRMCYDNRVYGMGLKSGGFRQFVRTQFQPLEPFGPQWYRLQDDDRYQGAFVWEGTHGVECRNRCGFLLTDIQRSN